MVDHIHVMNGHQSTILGHEKSKGELFLNLGKFIQLLSRLSGVVQFHVDTAQALTTGCHVFVVYAPQSRHDHNT